MALPVSFNASTNGVQYIRKITLLVSNSSGSAVDLSQFRIKFSVKQATSQTPNSADIRVYNLSKEAAIAIASQGNRVILQAGYNSNFGEIFVGNIKQVILGRETPTETFIDIIAGDGDIAYNHAVVVTSLAKGSDQNDEIKACLDQTKKFGVMGGAQSTVTSTVKRPRGKVMFGNARNFLRGVAKTTQCSWSIQNEQVQFVPNTGYLPGQAVLITAKTGMIGTPQQTTEGVNVKALLNPFIRINGRIKLENSTIERIKIDLTLTPGKTTNTAFKLPSDGLYLVIAAEHSGDTRGTEWYTSMICLIFDQTSNIPIGSVSNAP